MSTSSSIYNLSTKLDWIKMSNLLYDIIWLYFFIIKKICLYVSKITNMPNHSVSVLHMTKVSR